MVAGVGVELYFYTTFAHLLHDGASVFNAGILFAAAQEKDVELAVEVFGVAQYAGHFLLKVEVRSTTNAAEHAGGEDANVGKHLWGAQTDVERLATTHRKAAHSAALAVFLDSVVLFHKWYNIVNQFAAERLHTLPAVAATAKASAA